MFPLLNRFHAVQTAETPTRQLFARLSEQRLDVILADKAYVANVTKNTLPTARITGSCHRLSTGLLSIVLSTPATTAVFSQNYNELILTCVDKSSLRLVITLPVLPTPSEALLNELHQSLITAVASLEACLLATFGEHQHTEPTQDVHGLQAIHATPRHGKDPIDKFLPFRNMSSVNMSLLAARAFAAAQLASSCRAERLHQKQVLIERMKERKKRVRELVEQGRRQKTQRKRGRSIFVEYKPGQCEKQQELEGKQNSAHVGPLESNPSVKDQVGEQKEPDEMLLTKAESPAREEKQEPNQEQNQVAEEATENRLAEPLSSMPKRKRRKKARQLV
ncbi:hypothetical protein FGB62_7g434 [Gracilaria domingensis]|nr:hypothetical protein FGB62_7g434 [Gracilaria domingensis]